jgi:predicted ATPase
MSQPSATTHSEMVTLDQLLFDPNNYRFRDQANWERISLERVGNEDVQKRTRRFIEGPKGGGIDDLLRSFKANSFLPVDQIQVMPLIALGPKLFMVREGNRRVAALKKLREEYEQGFDVGIFDTTLFKGDNIQVVVSQVSIESEEEAHFEVLMGLKHIVGNKPWPTVNQARLIKSLLQKGRLEAEVKDMLGMSLQMLRRYVRALSLIEHYEKSDFGDQFKPEMFNIFSEVAYRPVLRNWLGAEEGMPTNEDNAMRFYSWISIFEEEGEEGDRIQREPFIATGSQVRELAELLSNGDGQALTILERERSLAKAWAYVNQQNSGGRETFETAFEAINSKMLDLRAAFARENPAHRSAILQLNARFADFIRNADLGQESRGDGEARAYAVSGFPLQKFRIRQFRAFENMDFDELKRFNVFGGENNAGKSTVLEALHLFFAQNDYYQLRELYRIRGKFATDMPFDWFYENLSPFEAEGFFGDFGKAHVCIKKDSLSEDGMDKNRYVGSVILEGNWKNAVGEEDYQETTAHVYYGKPEVLEYAKLRPLAPVAHTNTFSFQTQIPFAAHERNIDEKTHDDIIKFLRDHADLSLSNIDLTRNGIYRFKATNEQPRAIDISSYGDGFQRLYHLALHFALAKGGILLIDEIENAIHHRRFEEFVVFLDQLSKKFSVQVFITSHSKEFIDAIASQISQSELSVYRMGISEGRRSVRQINGELFARFIQIFNEDLRQ